MEIMLKFNHIIDKHIIDIQIIIPKAVYQWSFQSCSAVRDGDTGHGYYDQGFQILVQGSYPSV